MMMPDLAVSRELNPLWRILLRATEEILGQGVGSTLLAEGRGVALTTHQAAAQNNADASFGALGRFQAVLEQKYGTRPGRGLSLRIGRACFKYGLEAFQGQLGLNEPAFRWQPLPRRLERALQALAEFFRQTLGWRVRLETDEQASYWILEHCPSRLWQGQTDDTPCGCYLLIGLLQEMLYWVSGGHCFLLEEAECLASGGRVCTIKIHRTPLS